MLQGGFFLTEKVWVLCQSSCQVVQRQGFINSPLIDKNPGLTIDQTHISQCVSQTFGPLSLPLLCFLHNSNVIFNLDNYVLRVVCEGLKIKALVEKIVGKAFFKTPKCRMPLLITYIVSIIKKAKSNVKTPMNYTLPTTWLY